MRSWKGNKQKRAKLFSLGRKGPQGSFLCSWEIFMFFLKIQGNFKDSCKDAKSAPHTVICILLHSSLHYSSASAGGWGPTAAPLESGHTFNPFVKGQPWDRVPGGATGQPHFPFLRLGSSSPQPSVRWDKSWPYLKRGGSNWTLWLNTGEHWHSLNLSQQGKSPKYRAWAKKITLIFKGSSHITQQSFLETAELINNDRTEWQFMKRPCELPRIPKMESCAVLVT